MAQVNLETAEVLAWTLIAILLTAMGDLVFISLLEVPGKLRARRARILEAVR
jgi:hypothetical protein